MENSAAQLKLSQTDRLGYFEGQLRTSYRQEYACPSMKNIHTISEEKKNLKKKKSDCSLD